MANRRRVVVLVLVSMLCVSLLGLATEPWIQWVDYENEVHVSTVLDMAGEYWLIGTSVASLDPPDAGIIVFKIQPDGSLLSTSSYDWNGVQSAADALVTPDGTILFAGQTDTYGAVGSDMYVLQTDASGQTLAEWVLGGALEESARRIVLGTHGDYFIVGNQTNPEDFIADADAPGYGGLEGRTAPYIARIQPNGAPVWKESYQTTENIVVFDAIATNDGGCLVLGTLYGFPNAEDAIWIAEVNDLGQIAWSRTFDEGNSKGYSLLRLTNGQLLIAGARSSEAGGQLQALLMLLEANGTEVWSRTYGNTERITAAHALIETSDGHIVAAGTQMDGYVQYQDEVYLLCVDADGELQWEETHTTGKHVIVEALVERDDGGLLIAGSGATAGERFQAMLMRVDPQEEAETP